MNELSAQKFQIHYYLADDSHQMDAFVRNKAEKELLAAIGRIGELLECPIRVDSEAYKEGGLLETLIFVGAVGTAIKYFSPAINNILTYHFTRNTADEHLDRKIKEETLRSLKLDNLQKEKVLLDEIERKVSIVLEDKKVRRSVSNYYKRLDIYPKVAQVGFSDPLVTEEEQIVDRERFSSFFVVDTQDIEEDDNASIEIIAPVLNKGRYKWRGIYNGEVIEFSMGNKSFKDEVNAGQHSFIHGISITCHLKITITYDDDGEERKRGYSVTEVYSVQYNPSQEPVLRSSGQRKEAMKNQLPLLTNDEANDD